MRQHRIIWYITASLVAAAAVVLLVRNTAEAPGIGPEDNGRVIGEMVEALGRDPQARQEETRALVAKAAALARRGVVESSETYQALGFQLRNRKQYAAAEEAYRRAIELRPDWSWPHNGLGIVLHRLGRREEAEESFRRAIELEPNWSRPHNDLAILLRMMNRLDEASKEALLAIELDPDNLATQNNYGNLLVELERYEDAEARYRHAITLDPSHPAPYYNLACLACLTGDTEAVFSLLKQAIELDQAFQDQAAGDPDLATLRDHPKFKQLIGDRRH